MKKIRFSYILTPIALLGSASTFISCAKKDADGYIPFPINFLKITDNNLEGFNEGHTTKKSTSKYNKLKIPANIQAINDGVFNVVDDYTSPLNIKKIDFEDGCKCIALGDNFHGCTNLKVLVLPPLLDMIEGNAFANCKQLETIDVTNVEYPLTLEIDNWTPEHISAEGVILWNKMHTSDEKFINARQELANKLQVKLGTLWTVKEVKENQ